MQMRRYARVRRSKIGKPKNASKFICLKCLSSTGTIPGIQRYFGLKEENHVKDLWCCNCKETTKCLEVRSKDLFYEKMEKAKEIRENYYSGGDNNVDCKED